ncbi:MAG: gliding motility-associated C-terminal domain-containing protein [Bacteroidia bacterium]
MVKKLNVILFFSLLYIAAPAQQKFIKITDEVVTGAFPNGSGLRIFPTPDLGWVVFLINDLKLTKFNVCGESEWSKQYQVANTHSSLNDFIQMPNGDFLLLTRILKGTTYGSLLTRIDASGNVVWSKSYYEASYNHFSYTLSCNNQGEIFLYGNQAYIIANNTSYLMICKLNGNGNIIWTRFYDNGGIWGGAIVTSDQGILARTGNTLVKTDNAGNVQWTTWFYTGTYNFFAPVEVSDGYIFSGYGNNGTNYIHFFKIDSQGNLLLGGGKKSNFIGTPPFLRKRNNGNLVGVFGNNTTVVEFDNDLNIISQSSINNSVAGKNLYGKEICFLADGTPVVAGIEGSSAFLFFSRTDNNYHTNCDITPTPMSFTLTNVNHGSNNINVSSYTLNVTDENYSVNSFSVTETILCSEPKQIDLGNDTSFCQNATLTLQNHTSDVFDNYLWSTGETTAAITINQPGIYWQLGTDICEINSATDTIEINALPVIVADLGMDLLKCEDVTLVLTAPYCDSCLYTWSTGSMHDTIEITAPGLYWLSIENYNGCISSDTVEVEIAKCECDIYLPNAFTPNHDGLNELFNPVYYCDVDDYNLSIFNRWGQLMYVTDNIGASWNGKFGGKSVPEGIYVYRINYIPVINGKLNDRVSKSGTVAVIF